MPLSDQSLPSASAMQGAAVIDFDDQSLPTRVVNIALFLLLLIASAILFEYWRKYLLYFWFAVSVWVLAILFHIFFGNIRYEYFVLRCTSLSLSTTTLL